MQYIKNPPYLPRDEDMETPRLAPSDATLEYGTVVVKPRKEYREQHALQGVRLRDNGAGEEWTAKYCEQYLFTYCKVEHP